jgi:hypothetical protein
MSSFIRPSFEVIKEGRMLHFVSGSRRFVLNNRIIQEVAGSILAGLSQAVIQSFLFYFTKHQAIGTGWLLR